MWFIDLELIFLSRLHTVYVFLQNCVLSTYIYFNLRIFNVKLLRLKLGGQILLFFTISRPFLKFWLLKTFRISTGHGSEIFLLPEGKAFSSSSEDHVLWRKSSIILDNILGIFSLLKFLYAWFNTSIWHQSIKYYTSFPCQRSNK